MKKTKLIMATAAISCALVACAENSTPTATTSSSTETVAESIVETTVEEESTEAEEETAPETVAMGQTAPLNNWNITVSNMQILESIDDGYGSFVPEEGNKYLLVTVTAENTGKEADTFLPSFGLNDDVSTKVLYGDGYEFSLTQLLGYSKDLINSTINPLSSKEGDIAFELPNSVADSTEPLIIEFSAGNNNVDFALR